MNLKGHIMKLTQEQKQEAKELLGKLAILYKNRVELDLLKISRENAIKEEVASICDVRNKQGESQPNKVKMSLLSALIDEMFLNKENKKRQEYALMDTYENALNDVDENIISSYVALKESFNENTHNIKEAFKDTSVLDKEILEAIDLIAKEQYKELLNHKKLEVGIEIKPPKDMSIILEIIKELENSLS